jgi:hypothetical protein
VALEAEQLLVLSPDFRLTCISAPMLQQVSLHPYHVCYCLPLCQANSNSQKILISAIVQLQAPK